MLPTTERTSTVSLFEYLSVIRRHLWWGLGSFVILFGCLAIYILYWIVPVYQATALLEIEASYSVLSPVGTLTVPKVETFIQLIKSQEVLFKAMQELGLVGKDVSPLERERLLRTFAAPLGLKKLEGTSLVEISYVHPSATEAARIVNAILKVYSDKLLEDKEDQTDRRGVFIKQQLIDITNQLNLLEQKLQEMKVKGKTPEKTESLAGKLAQLELSYLTESTKLGVKHPTVAELEEEMEEVKKQLSQLAPSDMAYLETLREKRLNENLLTLLSSRLKELQMESADKTVPLKVVNWALVPGEPYKPEKRTNLIVALILSLIVGFMTIFLRQALDLSLDTPELVEDYLGLPVLLSIQRFKRLPARVTAEKSFLPEELALMERLRHLSPRLLSDRKTLALISPGKGSGKTTLATYYAIASALDGKNILVIDADFRNPKLHTRLNQNKSPGLSDILGQGIDIEQTIVKIPLLGETNINLIPAGHHTGSPLRFFNSPAFEEFLGTIKQRYDLIIIDTPPIFIAPETLVLCRMVDGYIIIHRPTRLDRYSLSRFRSQISSIKEKCLGVILNMSRYREADYYYYRYYDYGERHPE